MSFVGKLNIYTCEKCRGHIVTRDIDQGTTPFLVGCLAEAGCDGAMQSSMYRVFDQQMKPSHVWFRPAEPEKDEDLSSGVRQYLAMGGLIIRAATPEEAAATPS